MRLFSLLDRLVLALLGAALVMLVGVGGTQIVLRETVGTPLPWATEFSVVLMIWATMLSGYVGVRRNSHLSADFLGLSLSERRRRVLRTASLLLSLLFVVIYGWQSFVVIDAMEGIPFTSLPITQPVLYLSLPVGAVLMALALLERLWRDLCAEVPL
ncbi:MAG: TRAP transporter small permease [Hydrogenophaga sp.]|uniref:TRAP transporter small permease n=1 Tax=Hydrogenophaga sp. TaxID=1904254 RepID=UPI002ABA31AE|nr:TRAP transporter small permease [Hydrogenophaga sp.]MDZ4280623.1 TRAP transporter small permease [Hydrogenophaga sp.]